MTDAPADTIRQAATLIRQRAQAATHDGRDQEAVLDHIAAMHPGVARDLADLLDGIIDRHGWTDDYHEPPECSYCGEVWPCPDVESALAIARTILGPDPTTTEA